MLFSPLFSNQLKQSGSSHSRTIHDLIEFLILLVYLLCSYRCYYYIELHNYTKWMGWASVIILLYMTLIGASSFLCKRFRIELFIIEATMVSALLGVLSQGISTFPQYMPYLSFVCVFYLYKKRVNLLFIENILVLMAVIYILCWLFQIYKMPEIVFGDPDRDFAGQMTRGFYRFYIVTKEHSSFLVFYCLAMYKRTKKNLFLFIAITAFIVVIFHVGRQMIFWTTTMAVLYVILTNKNSLKNVIVFSVIVLILLLYLSSNEVILSLLDITSFTSRDINAANSNNIRFDAFYHFITEYNQSFLSVLFGSGFSTNEVGDSLRSMLSNSVAKGYYLDDVGFAALYVHFGLVSVILYVYLLIQTLFMTNAHPDYVYMKFYIGYLTLSFLGSHTLTSNLIFVVLCIFVLKTSEKAFLRQKFQKARK